MIIYRVLDYSFNNTAGDNNLIASRSPNTFTSWQPCFTIRESNFDNWTNAISWFYS